MKKLKWIFFLMIFSNTSLLGHTQLFGSLASDDFDAAKFMTTATITNVTQKDALNVLTKSMKAAGVWTKMYFIYPIVGGDAAKHSYNLKDPGTYQITWVGSPTHSSTGVDFFWNYGRITLNASSVFPQYDNHLSFYTRETYGGNDYPTDMGVADFSVSPNRYFSLKFYSPLNNGSDYTIGYDGVFASGSRSAGYMLGTMTSQSTYKLYSNGSEIGSNTASTNSTALPNLPYMVIGGGHWNYTGSANNYSQRQMCFATGGASLTTVEAGALQSAVNKFQTTLSRNIY